MKCSQCDKPSLYHYGDDVRLCLDCHYRAQQTEHWRNEHTFKMALVQMAMLNEAKDSFDSIASFGPPSYRLPVAQIAMAGVNNSKMTHINISNSQVGVLNTGDLAKIDALVTVTQGTDSAAIGLAIKQLIEAVLEAKEMSTASKREVGELLSGLSDQITGNRSRTMIGSILKAIEDRVQGINGVWSLFEKLSNLMSSLPSGGS